LIHWYGVFYVVALALGALALPYLEAYRNLKLTTEQRIALLAWTFVGVVLGGRLGYVLFYDPAYYFIHPGEVLALSQGGMASHGGFIGVGIALWLFSRAYKVPLRAIADVIIIPAAVGLALGRVGNMINGELPGILIAPTSPFGLLGARYPWPLLEAVKNIVLAGVCYYWLRYKHWPAGTLTAVFLIVYSVLRMLLELVREPSHVLGYLGSVPITEEQLLTFLLFLAGLGLLLAVRHTNHNANNKQTI
jgi:phosphatidylglycerol:prolipoprotein diacylglycerol transferase